MTTEQGNAWSLARKIIYRIRTEVRNAEVRYEREKTVVTDALSIGGIDPKKIEFESLKEWYVRRYGSSNNRTVSKDK